MVIGQTRFCAVTCPLSRDGILEASINDISAIHNGCNLWLPRDPDLNSNSRWLAYALATTSHQTGERMMPVCEKAGGTGHLDDESKPPNAKIDYGCSYVQLTWDAQHNEGATT